METTRQYTSTELKQLHTVLYEILEEVVRVCSQLEIPFFMIGGSAIGVYYWNGIIPWDDDIDIGMTRKDYDNFLREAPKYLRKDFFLQWVDTDPHVPFYFAKVRKNNTKFVESAYKSINMHHGLYVDIFPFDKVPDNTFLQKSQRAFTGFLNSCFIGKDIWQWKYFGKCELETPRKRNPIACLLTRISVLFFTKIQLYKMLTYAQKFFNKTNASCYNLVTEKRDHIPVEDVENLQNVKFGSLTVNAPSNIKRYLKHHYPGLRKYVPKEEQENHRPSLLSF